MARIVHSPAAEDDLLEIWVGLAEINIFAAKRLLDDLHAATQLLATQPLIGKARREFGAGIRSFPVRDYVIVYRPIRGGVELARVVHGALREDLFDAYVAQQRRAEPRESLSKVKTLVQSAPKRRASGRLQS
jgi:toxin ParE1/3/4